MSDTRRSDIDMIRYLEKWLGELERGEGRYKPGKRQARIAELKREIAMYKKGVDGKCKTTTATVALEWMEAAS